MSLFNLNTSVAIVHRCLPNHPKAEDSPRTCEIQMRDVLCKPMAAAALATPKIYDEKMPEADKAADRMRQFIDAMFVSGSKDFPDRFLGFGAIEILHVFRNHHQVKFGELPEHRVERIDKIRMTVEGGHDQAIKLSLSIHLEDPSEELVAYLHERTNRAVQIVLTHSQDQTDELIAEREGMAAPTQLPNLDLDFDAKAQRDTDQIDAVAEHLTAEIPLRGAKRKPAKKAAKKPAKKAGKRGAKKKAA